LNLKVILIINKCEYWLTFVSIMLHNTLYAAYGNKNVQTGIINFHLFVILYTSAGHRFYSTLWSLGELCTEKHWGETSS